MGRYTGPACKLCRRQGTKLFLKGERCYMAKCAVEQGRPAPGQHGARRSKLSDYGAQLREKQKLRRMYGMQESQFRVFFARAQRQRGITGLKLLQALELRLDNIVYRCGMAPSRRSARQFVLHGHVRVNGRKSSIPSTVLKVGDVIDVKDVKGSRDYAAKYMEKAETHPGFPVWITVDRGAFRGEIMHVPTREEIAPEVNEQMIVELYSK